MMRRLFNLLVLPAMLLCRPSFAQDPSAVDADAARRAEAIRQQQQMQATSKEFDRILEEARRPAPNLPRPNPGASRVKFLESVQLFRQATTQYREAIGLSPDLTRQARNIEKLIDPLKSYFHSMNVKGTAVDRSEYANLSPKDLAWETLTLAETIDNNLQVAQRIVTKSDRDGVVDIKSLQFFDEIQTDLARLSFLASRIKK